jgi:hypothetical protein
MYPVAATLASLQAKRVGNAGASFRGTKLGKGDGKLGDRERKQMSVNVHHDTERGIWLFENT